MERLARGARDRRLALGLTQKQAAAAAGVSDQTWLNVENGKPASDRTLAGVDRALRWQQGSARRLLEGGEPDPVGEHPRTIEERLAAIEARVSPEPPRPGETFEERLTRLEQRLGVNSGPQTS